MAFPDTRHSLIQRLAGGGEPADWREFMEDYWGPLCRFAQYRAKIDAAEAEDIAAQTLEAIIRNQLLGRWSANRSARLRTLICAVVRNVISNRARVNSGRERLIRENAHEIDRLVTADGAENVAVPPDQSDAFYAAWAADVVQVAVERLLAEYTAAGKVDHFRVLYGRICDGLTMAEIADALGMKLTSAENCYRQAKLRLEERLRDTLRQHVMRYSPIDAANVEFTLEWNRLGEFLQAHGGLETAVRESYAAFSPDKRRGWAMRIEFQDRPRI
jgi:RNA polymerase sigma factor (sigma-70 family)